MAARTSPVLYISAWFFFSSAIIFTNRYILVELEFPFPVMLTTYHLTVATIATRLLRRFTHMVDGVEEVNKRLTWGKWSTSVLPIGILFSGSLACGNYAYVYLSVSFIQMLKSATPVVVLLMSWLFGTEKPNLGIFLNVLFITFGITIASYGEINFVLVGFVLQSAALVFESTRLVMIQKLLSGRDLKMEALVGLYYFAPVCAVTNAIVAYLWEGSTINYEAFARVGFWVFIFNGATSFCLNVSSVMVIKKTSTLILALCGLIKDIGIVGVAPFIFHGEIISAVQGFGYCICLLGLVRYKTRTEPFWTDPVHYTMEFLTRRSNGKGGYQATPAVYRSSVELAATSPHPKKEDSVSHHHTVNVSPPTSPTKLGQTKAEEA
ncbi:triose-phosphate transporter family-domain-containing protein [Phlyctochytrium arcticum]|nr:triose-phosphate transporter family-domain-containing protein [Phlyctochytrium arcticum]